MGNALISKILFQPPTPPNALTYHGSNLKVSYLWIYNFKSSTLIPALHVTHPPPSDHNGRYGNSASVGKYTLLYSHGNAEDLGLIAHFLTDLARLLGVNVLCYDYAGYGVSTDKVAVSCFLREYGRELEAWKADRASKSEREQSDALTSSIGEESIFVAPMVYPNSFNGVSDEFDFVDEEDGDGDGGDGNSSCLGSCDGDAGVAYGQREEEEDNGGFFANACGVGTYEPEPDGKALEARLYHRSNVQRMEENHPMPIHCGLNRGHNEHFISPKAKRRNLLANHSWTPPVPSEQQCYSDIQSAFDYLTQVKNISPQNILMYGKSVGSGPTCWLAQKLCGESPLSPDGVSPAEGREESHYCDARGIASPRAPGGVVLHSPFLSVIRVVVDMGFTAIGDLFPNIDRVNDFTCPVYVIHGTQDEIVPFYHGESLFNLLPDSSRTVPFWARGAGHNNIEMEMPTAYIKRLHQFIRQCDRLLHPNVKLNAVANKAFPIPPPSASPQIVAAAHHPGMKCASGASLNWAAANTAHLNTLVSNHHQDPNDHLTPEQRNINKQRKQRGTLVMKSSHNAQPQISYPRAPAITSASKNAEQRRQQQLRSAQQYLTRNSPAGRIADQYHRANSAPIMVSQQQHRQHMSQAGGAIYRRE